MVWAQHRVRLAANRVGVPLQLFPLEQWKSAEDSLPDKREFSLVQISAERVRGEKEPQPPPSPRGLTSEWATNLFESNARDGPGKGPQHRVSEAKAALVQATHVHVGLAGTDSGPLPSLSRLQAHLNQSIKPSLAPAATTTTRAGLMSR